MKNIHGVDDVVNLCVKEGWGCSTISRRAVTCAGRLNQNGARALAGSLFNTNTTMHASDVVIFTWPEVPHQRNLLCTGACA